MSKLKWLMFWTTTGCAVLSLAIMISIVRADEVKWIYRSDETGKELVVLNLDNAPESSVVEVWSDGVTWRVTREQLKALVAEAGKQQEASHSEQNPKRRHTR